MKPFQIVKDANGEIIMIIKTHFHVPKLDPKKELAEFTKQHFNKKK